MIEKVILWSISIVITLALLVFVVETVVIPLDMNMKFRTDCRNTLLDIEITGTLSLSEENFLKTRLEGMGLSNVIILGTTNAKYGDEIFLKVSATYAYSPLTSLFNRSETEVNFVYEKYSRSRHVFN